MGADMKRLVITLTRVAGLLLLTAAAALAADAPPPDLKVTALGPNLELLVGQGSNMVLGWTTDSAVIVDTSVTADADRLAAHVREKIGSAKLTVINTHYHFDHVQGNAALAGLGATIAAHRAAAVRIASGNDIEIVGMPHMHFDAAPKQAAPSQTYDRRLTLNAGGDTLILVHVANAHTDGDTLVKWQKANLLNMGDTYVGGGFPLIDFRAGGSLDGLIETVKAGLGLCENGTRVIPGHGGIKSCNDLEVYRDRLQAIAVPLRAAIKDGKSLDEIQAMRLADSWVQANARVKPDQFIAMAYGSYTQAK
jgi:cyclase